MSAISVGLPGKEVYAYHISRRFNAHSECDTVHAGPIACHQCLWAELTLLQ